MVETIKWQFKSNGINFIVFDPDNEFRTVAECPTEQDAKTICELQATAVYWADQQLREAEKRGECEHELDKSRGNLASEFERVERERDTLRSALVAIDRMCEEFSGQDKEGFSTDEQIAEAALRLISTIQSACDMAGK